MPAPASASMDNQSPCAFPSGARRERDGPGRVNGKAAPCNGADDAPASISIPAPRDMPEIDADAMPKTIKTG